MPGLAEFQASFDRALRGGALPAGLTSRDPAETERRFDVYRNNVAVSLTEALAARFPVILRLVGGAFFRQMARLYLDAQRPESPVLARWGRGFPGFLERFNPLRAYPFMADVARIEYQRGLAFHAADRAPAPPALFTAADPAALRLGLHPSLAVLRLDHAAVSVWAANQPGSPPARIAGGREIALVYRDPGFDVPVRSVSTGDASMIEALQRGLPLLAAAEIARADEPFHDPARLLGELMASGLIIATEN